MKLMNESLILHNVTYKCNYVVNHISSIPGTTPSHKNETQLLTDFIMCDRSLAVMLTQTNLHVQL